MRPWLILALLAAATLAPLAASEHVFSHRLYVTGRIVDAHGLPIPGAPVVVSFDALPATTPRCAAAAFGPEVTSATGDFTICRHTHALPAVLHVTVSVASVNATKPVDTTLRHAYFHLQADGERPTRDVQGDRDFNATFRVAARVFEILPAPTNAENVQVGAVPRIEETVEAELRRVSDGERLAQGVATTDEAGDATIDLPVGAFDEPAIVIVQAAGLRREVDASPLHRRADAYVVLEVVDQPVGPRPGESTPGPGLALAVVAVALAAIALRRR